MLILSLFFYFAKNTIASPITGLPRPVPLFDVSMAGSDASTGIDFFTPRSGYYLHQNHSAMKHLFFSFFVLLGVIASGQRTDQPWQLDLGAGLHSFYAPVENLKWSRPELVTTASLNKLMSRKQLFSVGLQLGYARNNYQGDALFVQLLGQITPVIAQKLEIGFGLGAGYRLALYPSPAQKWDGANWIKGHSFKGVIQVPLQFSLGYRSLRFQSLEFRPYAAWQLQGLFRYSPDLSPLPVSAFLMGMKIHNYKK